MAQNSSTSDSDPRGMSAASTEMWTRRLLAIAFLSWAVYGIAWCVSGIISPSVGDLVVQAMRQRTYDGVDFLLRRIFDFAHLTTIICLLSIAFLWLCFFVQRRLNRALRVALLTAVGFILVNVFTLAAMQTTTYWLALLVIGRDYQLHSTEVEWRMLVESDANVKGVILGSSQASAQIDARYINRDLGPDAQFANLSYLGSQSFTILMLQDYLQAYPDVVVCYLSGYNFFQGVDSSHLLTLWNKQSAEELNDLDALRFLPERGQTYGKVASVLPVFRCHSIFELILFGKTAPLAISGTRITPEQRKIAGEHSFRDKFRIDETTEFQEAAMEQLVKNCQSHGTKVFLISGTITKTEHTTIDPKFDQHLRDYLARLQDEYDNVTVLTEGEELPRGKPSQYKDILHLRDEYRPWYSRAVAERLAEALRLQIREDAAAEAILE